MYGKIVYINNIADRRKKNNSRKKKRVDPAQNKANKQQKITGIK